MPRSKGSQSTGTGSPPSSGKPRRKPSNSSGHDCTICRKSNMTLSGLKIHLLTHSGEKPFLCTECDKRFTCSSNLKKHQRIHTRDYIYECPVCGKTCSDPSNMKKHMTVHSDEKAYTCPSCGKSYSYAQSLRQHMDDVHVANGERRRKSKKKGHFPCPECGKVFGYYWRCSLHQARIHAVEKPYKCPECGKSFARETILNKHIQTHEKPFPCTVCDRRFSFRDQLRKHMRTHTGEKPYTCDQCLRSFTQRGSLTEHIRTHTGEKPFACKNCGQKFSSSSSLKRHERRVNACQSRSLTEEIPLTENAHRRVIYISTQPVTMIGLGSSAFPMELGDDPGYSVTFSPIEQDYGNGTIAFYPSTLSDSGQITMVPGNLSPSMPMDNARFVVPGEYANQPTLRQDGSGRITVGIPDLQPNGRISMVSNNIEHSIAIGNYQLSGHQSIAMDINDMESRALPLSRSITTSPTEDVMSSQHDPIHPSVTLTTDGLKPLASVEHLSNYSANYSTQSSNYLYIDNSDYYSKQLSPVGPSPVTFHSTSTEDVQSYEETYPLSVASTNVRPPSQYPRIAAVAEDVKLLSEISGINSMASPHLLPNNGTTMVTV